MQLTLAIRNLGRRKSRTILSALGIILGVAMIISLVSVSEGLKESADDFSRQIGTNIVLAQEGNFGPPMTSSLDESIVEDLEKIPGVKVVSPIIVVPVRVAGSGGRHGIFSSENQAGIVGVDPTKERLATSDYTKIVAGRFIKEGDSEKLVLGAEVSREMNLRVGDELKFRHGTDEFSYEVVGIYETGSADADQDIITTLSEARFIGHLPRTRINIVTVVPTSPGRVEELERKIRLLIPGVDPSYGRSFANLLTTFTRTLQLATWVIAGISAVIGGIGIMNTMVMSVMEQTKEIGVLRSVGWRSKDILAIILAESIGISAIGAFLGVVVGLVVTVGILPQIFRGALSPVVTPIIVVEAFFFAIFLGVIGGVLPAKRASELTPLEAFRNEE